MAPKSSTQIFCGKCQSLVPASGASQLIPCLHTICIPCFEKHLQHSQLCPVQHCYSYLTLSADQKWNSCENERCERKLCDATADVCRTNTCLHDLCGKCLDDAYKTEKPTCPVAGCNTFLDEDATEKCGGPCGENFEVGKLHAASCCQIRMCSPCAEKWNGGKGTCPPEKCQPADKRPKKSKRIPNFRKTPCQGMPDCEGEVLRSFPSVHECDHLVCLSCLNASLNECERKGIAPLCPAESCRLPYRCATVLALKVLFPEKTRYFNRFELNSQFSMEALKDDTNLRICEDGAQLANLIEIRACFCEEDEIPVTFQFDPTGSFGDLLREIRRVLKIKPWQRLYGYFQRDGNAESGTEDKPIVVNPKSIAKQVADMHFVKETLIMVDITGIVNAKRKPSKAEGRKDNKNKSKKLE